jgi:Domain of unknown function (DUF4385)
MPAKVKPSYLNFNKAAYPWKPGINYRSRPKRYCVGKGEQRVLICEPYKSEIAPHWRFKTPAIATRSARSIYKMFVAYLDNDEFVGADLARKFLQMGYTRARRYANYKGGQKYDKDDNYKLKECGTGEPEKAVSALFSTSTGRRLKPRSATPPRRRRGKAATDETADPAGLLLS